MNPTETLEWISVMKEVMAMFIMTNPKKVKFATYLLRGDAKV